MLCATFSEPQTASFTARPAVEGTSDGGEWLVVVIVGHREPVVAAAGGLVLEFERPREPLGLVVVVDAGAATIGGGAAPGPGRRPGPTRRAAAQLAEPAAPGRRAVIGAARDAVGLVAVVVGAARRHRRDRPAVIGSGRCRWTHASAPASTRSRGSRGGLGRLFFGRGCLGR